VYEMLSTPMLCSSVHWGFGKRMDQNDLLGDICNRLLLYAVRTINVACLSKIDFSCLIVIRFSAVLPVRLIVRLTLEWLLFDVAQRS